MYECLVFEQQIVVRSARCESTVLHYVNTIAVLQRVQPVGYHYNGSGLRRVTKCAEDGLFGCAVEGAGGFVEDEDFGVAVKRASEADSLALPSAEADASLADDGVVFLGKSLDEIVKSCYA